jgi:TonB-dependent receptor
MFLMWIKRRISAKSRKQESNKHISRLVFLVVCVNLASAFHSDIQAFQAKLAINIFSETQSELNNNITVYQIDKSVFVSVEIEEMLLIDALSELANKVGIGLSYSSDFITDQKVSLAIQDVTFFTALNNLLNNTGFEATLPPTRDVLVIRNSKQPDIIRGSVRGKVTDASTGESLIGANVILSGTSIGTTTDINGEFLLANIPEGNQTLRVQYLGYLTRNFDVTIISGESVELNIQLSPDVVQSEEIVIYTQALAQAKAIREQISSNSIINVVSEDRIRELPDANAAESVGRLPGVSIIRNAGEGQRVAIRGLAPRHNAITFEGARVPSTDEDGRAVDLNMISSEMLAGIEVYKTNRPDMDADAIGGSVNFRIAGAPEGRRIRLNMKSGYNNHVQKIGTYNGSISGSDRYFNNVLGIATSLDFQRNDRSSDVFSGSYKVLRDARDGELHAPIGVDHFAINDRKETRDRYGASLMMDVNLPNGKLRTSNFVNRLDRSSIQLRRTYNLERFQQHWALTNRESTTDVYSNRIAGEHYIGSSTIEWGVSRTVSNQSTPYNHTVIFDENAAFVDSQIDQTKGPTYIPEAARNDFQNTHFQNSNFTDTRNNETDYVGHLDFKFPLMIGSIISGEFKIGGKYSHRDRIRDGRDWLIRGGDGDVWIPENEQRDWIYTNSGRLSMANYIDPDYNSRSILGNQYDMSLGLDRRGIRNIWSIHQESHIERLTIRFNDQDVLEKTSAAYAMTELNIGNRLMVLPGIRYEHTDSEYIAKRGQVSGNYRNQGNIVDTVAVQQFGMFFPMVQIRYKITDWFDIRAARTETASRPNFSELLPREEISANDRTVRRGRPNLRPAESTNYDLFFSTYSNKIGLFTIGLFYKSIHHLIYHRSAIVLYPEDENLQHQTLGYDLFEPFNNPNETVLRGYEIEWQSNLTYLPGLLRGLVINANYSRIWSETQYPQHYIERTPQGFIGIDTYREGPMVHQPDHVANISVGYDFRGLSARVSMLYQGATLQSVGVRQETDSFTDNYIRWDATVKQTILQRLDLFINIHNITNRRDGATQFTGIFPTEQEYYGWSADVGVRYKFY